MLDHNYSYRLAWTTTALDGPDAHAVVGLVLGAFGELSISCYSFCTSIARVAAARLLSFWKMSPEQALAFSKQKILCFWGLTGQRGWARLILDRLHDLVLSVQVAHFLSVQEVNRLFHPSKGKPKDIKSSMTSPNTIIARDLVDLQKLK